MRPLLRSVSDQSWSEKIEYYAWRVSRQQQVDIINLLMCSISRLECYVSQVVYLILASKKKVISYLRLNARPWSPYLGYKYRNVKENEIKRMYSGVLRAKSFNVVSLQHSPQWKSALVVGGHENEHFSYHFTIWKILVSSIYPPKLCGFLFLGIGSFRNMMRMDFFLFLESPSHPDWLVIDRTELYWFHEYGYLDAITPLLYVLPVHSSALLIGIRSRGEMR